MTVWLWVIVGLASFLALSIAAGFGLAAVLGSISREVSELLESEPWASAPLMRADEPEKEVSAEHVVGRWS